MANASFLIKYLDLAKIFAISAVPLVEQRGAIPVGIIVYGVNPLVTFALSFLGSLFPAPFVLLFFNAAFKWMKKHRAFDFLTGFIEKKVRRGSKKVERYKEIGLIAFVAIPLPTTGLWTGSAIAAFLGLDFKKSLLCVALGGLISASLITFLSMAFPALLGY